MKNRKNAPLGSIQYFSLAKIGKNLEIYMDFS